jgi:plastocyanin
MFTNSRRHKLQLLSSVLAILFSLGLTLTAVMDLPPAQANRSTVNAPPTSTGSSDVSISGFAFNPAVTAVAAGTTVTWTNLDAFPHTTTSDVGSSDPWDSGSLGQGAIFTMTFNSPGSYGYFCTIHPGMTGTVIVLAASVYFPLVLR